MRAKGGIWVRGTLTKSACAQLLRHMLLLLLWIQEPRLELFLTVGAMAPRALLRVCFTAFPQ